MQPTPLRVFDPIRGAIINMEEAGHPHGQPVFLLHGMPGGSTGPKPAQHLLNNLKVRLITFDRPGYGGSTRQPGRTVADGAHIVAAIANALDIQHFAVIGRSGGAPHALATAAIYPSRVTRVAAVASTAPVDAEGLNWHHGMAPSNITAYTLARTDPDMLAQRIAAAAATISLDPTRLLGDIRHEAAPADHHLIDEQQLHDTIAAAACAGLRQGSHGWFDDIMALTQPWGFDPATITTTPTRLWHGVNDQFAPYDHAVWLHNRITNAGLRTEHGSGHFAAFAATDQLLPWLAGLG